MMDWASSGRVKIERAYKHIHDLEAEIRKFRLREPYTVIGEDDSETGDRVFRARIREHPPLYFGAIAGDAIHNLRASLDALWRFAIRPRPDDRSGFRIFATEKKFKESGDGRIIKSWRKPIVSIYNGLQPYKGGNQLLWILHEADIIDKHWGLIPAYTTADVVLIDYSVLFTLHGLADPGPWFTAFPLQPPICPVEDGAVIRRILAADRPKVAMNQKFPLSIAFGETEILKGKAIIPLLNAMAKMVENIVTEFAAVVTGLSVSTPGQVTPGE